MSSISFKKRKTIPNSSTSLASLVLKKARHRLNTLEETSSTLAARDPENMQEKLTATNQRQSPLLRLPGEIRNRIYELVFERDLWPLTSNKREHPKKRQRYSQSNPLNILQTCRQIQAEAALLPYQLSTFQFPEPRVLRSWLQTRSPNQRAVITSIQATTFIFFSWDGRQTATCRWSDWQMDMDAAISELPALEHFIVRAFANIKHDEKPLFVAKLKKTVKKLKKEMESKIKGRKVTVEVWDSWTASCLWSI